MRTKIVLNSKFVESEVKGETYFAKQLQLKQTKNKVTLTEIIKTSYIDCKVKFELNEDDIALIIHLIESSYSNWHDGKIDRDDNTIDIFCRRFDQPIIFIRMSVFEQPVCCFKMTPDQIKDLNKQYKLIMKDNQNLDNKK